MESGFKKDIWIWIEDLQVAKQLNGMLGQVINFNKDKDRYEVFIPESNCKGLSKDSISNAILAKKQDDEQICKLFRWRKGQPEEGRRSNHIKLIKAENLKGYDGQLVECQYVAPGQPFGHVQSFWYPRNHPMFLVKEGNSPVMNRCGYPLIVVRYPYNRQNLQEYFGNQFAAYLLIDVKFGFAPPEWQNNVGPVLVYRPQTEGQSIKNFNILDFEIVWDFFNNILDHFGDGPGAVVAKRDFTFKKLREFTENYCLRYASSRSDVSLEGQNIIQEEF